MFSALARGVGSWTGGVTLPTDARGVTASTTRECRSAASVDHPIRDYDVSPLSLNSHNGVHRHGITVSSHSLSSSPAAPSDQGELILPRTFTTRKGALMLFADDTQVDYAHGRRLLSSTRRAQTRFFQDELEKLGSLTRLSSSVLMFGDKDYDNETCSISNPENKVFMKFLKSLGGLEVDLNVQPGGYANDYLRNLRHRLIRAKLKSGNRRRPLNDGGQGRLVQSMSSIPQLNKSPDHVSRERQIHVADSLRSEVFKEPELLKEDFSSAFSVAEQTSETVVPVDCYSTASLPGAYDETFRTASRLHDLWDKCESPTHPISSVLNLTNLSLSASRRQSLTGSNLRFSGKETTDEEAKIQTSELTRDEENEDLNLAYGMLRDYDSQEDYYDVDEKMSPEIKSQNDGDDDDDDEDDDDEIDVVQPLMPAYDPTYEGLPSINKSSFPNEVSRIERLLPPPPAPSVGAKPHSATPRASSGHARSIVIPPKNRPSTARTTRPLSVTSTATTAREVKSAGHSVHRSPIINVSRTKSKEISVDQLVSEAKILVKNSKDQAAETNVSKTDEDKRLSKTLRITRMRTPRGREKKENVPTVLKEPEEKTANEMTAEAVDHIQPQPQQRLPIVISQEAEVEQEDSSEQAKGEVVETEVVETSVSNEEVTTALISSRRKSKKTKGVKKPGEDNGLQQKLDADKVALRETRRKNAQVKKLLTGEEKRLAAERKLAEESRLAEKEKMAEKRERDKEDFAELAEKEAKLKVEIADALRKAEEAREIEDAARTALAATWKLACEHREEQRKTNIEKRKQELIERNRKEQECIVNAKRKEQEMLERLGSIDELRRFREAERLRKEEAAHTQMMRLEEEEYSSGIAYEKEEERYLDMEREAEEAAMAKIVQERLEAEQRPEMLKERQRRLQTEGSRKQSALLAEEREREERLRELQEEQERMDEEAKQRQFQMQKMQEEAVEHAQQVREARCNAALQRRELNIKNRRHLESLRHDQTNINQPWTFSYYVHWPRETYAKVMSQDPRKKPGFRPPMKHSARN